MKLSNRLKFSYGIGAIGKDIVYALVAGFLLYYYNTVLGISTAFIGTLFMVARLFDAFNDPIMGIIVNKTHGKLGRFRPWIITGTVLNALVIALMFNLPVFENHRTLLVVSSVVYILWGITYTIMDIPFWSFIPALTTDVKERESITVIARVCAGVGYALPTALTLWLVDFVGDGDERLGFSVVSIIVCIIFVLSSILVFFNVKENTVVTQKTPTVKEMFKLLVDNDQAVVLVISVVLFNASLYLTQNLAIYFFSYDIGNASLYGVFGTIGGATQILSMTAFPKLRERFTRKFIFHWALIVTIVGYLGLFILGTLGIKHIVGLSIMAAIIFVGFGLGTVLSTIFLADCVDYGEWKTGTRAESVIISLQTFVVKFAAAISVFVAGWGLEFIGLDETLEIQSTFTLVSLRILMTIIPIIGIACCIVYFRKNYKLDDEYYNSMMVEVMERRND